MKKKILGTGLIIALLASIGCQSITAKNEEIKVIYDGQEVEFDVQPQIINGRVMVPMRTIFETFGAKVKWDGAESTVTAKRKSKTMVMTVGSTEMTKNEETYTFDTAPIIEDGRTLVPVRAISDMLGLDVEWDEDDRTVVIETPDEDTDDSWKENTGEINLSAIEVSGAGVSVSDNVVTITAGGDFTVTGELNDGQIVVDTDDKVKLRLSGMSLTNKSGSAIYIKNADKAYITLTEGTENHLADGEEYVSGDENEKACITSRDNLEIKGNGMLTVTGNYNHGIFCADSLGIGNGNIAVNAKNDGIHANETLAISGGIINVTAEGDGIQAEEIIDITAGEIKVTTTGEVKASANSGFGMRGGMNNGIVKNPVEMTDEERTAMREEMQKQLEQAQQQEAEEDNSEDITSKGIKAGWLMDISGGEITVNSTDHAIHCASDITIDGGSMTLASEVKKGISAHGDIVINDGNINVTKSTEGIETKQIMTVNGGIINITASDDGLNAGGNGNEMPVGFGGGRMGGTNPENNFTDGGNMQPGRAVPEGEKPQGMGIPPEFENNAGGQQGRKGMNRGETEMSGMAPSDMPERENVVMPQGGRGSAGRSSEISAEHHIQINGGTIYINAKNDGIDSNGSVVIDGGKLIVEGPPSASGGEMGIDTDSAFIINGGEIISSGTSISDTGANQNSVNINFSESIEAGSEFQIRNGSGSIIAALTTAAPFYSILYSSENLCEGETYHIYVNNTEKASFTVSGKVTTVGTAAGGMGGFGKGGRTRQQLEQPQSRVEI